MPTTAAGNAGPAFATTVASPVGALRLVARDEDLVAVLWETERPGRVPLAACVEAVAHPLLRETAAQLAAYFASRLTVFDLPLAPQGTAFQRRVWAALRAIPYGETRSYGWLAGEVGSPKAFRAVGAANGRNPLSIIVPCHRAIGSGGTLTGFAGGLAAKAILLRLEARQREMAV